jgi:hypothetical protein
MALTKHCAVCLGSVRRDPSPPARRPDRKVADVFGSADLALCCELRTGWPDMLVGLLLVGGRRSWMKVFISSTYRDLVDHRRAVADAVERLGLQLERMESFGARPEEPLHACLAEVEDSELFVGIYAHRYGYIPVDATVSITEVEFEHALAHRRPTFCFFLDDSYPWPDEFVEKEPGRTKLATFRDRVQKLVVRDLFTTPEVLGSRVASSIGRYLIGDPRRHGAPNTAEFALLILADAVAAVFVDVMRLTCVAGSDLARAANENRYDEFVDIADEHFSDFRLQVTRLAQDSAITTVKACSEVELTCLAIFGPLEA